MEKQLKEHLIEKIQDIETMDLIEMFNLDLHEVVMLEVEKLIDKDPIAVLKEL